MIVLGGAGEKAFTAGGDIPGFMTRTPEELSHLAKNIAAAERCPKPVVAKLHGFTFGVGLELALACDLRVAADDTVLGLPEITLGMIPGSGGTQRLAHLVGLSRAKDAILRGRRIPADEALQWGLVAEVVPLADLDRRTTEIALELAAKAPLALKVAKRVLNLAYDTPLHVGLELEGLAYGLLRSTDDFAEGVSAFAERRPPEIHRLLSVGASAGEAEDGVVVEVVPEVDVVDAQPVGAVERLAQPQRQDHRLTALHPAADHLPHASRSARPSRPGGGSRRR